MIFIMICRHRGLCSNGPLSPVKSKMACDHCNGKKVSVIFCIAWRAFFFFFFFFSLYHPDGNIKGNGTYFC